jgi:hypothetical protein
MHYLWTVVSDIHHKFKKLQLPKQVPYSIKCTVQRVYSVLRLWPANSCTLCYCVKLLSPDNARSVTLWRYKVQKCSRVYCYISLCKTQYQLQNKLDDNHRTQQYYSWWLDILNWGDAKYLSVCYTTSLHAQICALNLWQNTGCWQILYI